MLIEYLKTSGTSRATFADAAGISMPYLSDLLNGKKVPSLRLAAKIERLTDGAVLATSWVDVEQEDAA